jgi:hypothetical protein
MKKTSKEWCKYFGINPIGGDGEPEILDPDGWDRTDFERSWNEKITEQEFKKRLEFSTVQFTPGVRRALGR